MDEEFEVSAELREALREVAQHPKLEIPEPVDARIRAAARVPRKRPARIRRVAFAAATAAALLVAIGIWALGEHFRRSEGTPRAVARIGDVDGDGHVDIVDAYLLDRRLGSSPSRGDVNGDGRIDEADVRLLIERIVAISGRKG